MLSLLQWVTALAAPVLWALGMAVAWSVMGVRLLRRRWRERHPGGRHRKRVA